jgi:hypothetical protein
MTGISTNERRSITAFARENASADLIIEFREIILTAVRKRWTLASSTQT